MKRSSIFKMFMIAVLAMICVCSFGAVDVSSVGSPHELITTVFQSDYSGMLAVAPIAAVVKFQNFNSENLKISIEEFEQLQVKFGKLHVVDINIDTDESYQFIVRRPTRQLLSAIAANRDDLDKANELIIKNMVVAGDLDSLSDGIVYTQLMKGVGSIMERGSVFLSKA